MKTTLLHLLCFASIPMSSLRAEFRTWSNSEGSKLDAEWVKTEGENVTFRLRNGNLTTFSETKLSAADRDFLKKNNAQAPQEPQPAVNADRKAKWQTKLSRAQEESKETGLPILMLFTGTSWCSYCIKLEKEVFAETAFKTFANENLVLLILDYGPGGTASGREQKKLQQDYGVSGFPSYFLTDASGAKLAKGGYHEGINPEGFAKWVKDASPKAK